MLGRFVKGNEYQKYFFLNIQEKDVERMHTHDIHMINYTSALAKATKQYSGGGVTPRSALIKGKGPE